MGGRGHRSARSSDRRHAREPLEQQAHDGRGGACARQMDGDPGFHLGDAGGDLDEAQAQGVELGAPPRRSARQRRAQGPHQPVGVGVQEQAQLVGGHCQRKLGCEGQGGDLASVHDQTISIRGDTDWNGFERTNG